MLRTSVLAVVLAAPAAAQSFNLDVGDNLILWALPSSAHGAAAGQPGTWNNVKTPYSHTLLRLDGSTSGVTCASTHTTAFNSPFSGLTGDDEALMADVQHVNAFSGIAVWTFNGLLDGAYRVYTHAWDPGSSHAGFTSVEVPGSLDPLQVIGGSWSGGPHVQGTTYALHHVVVAGGTLTVNVAGASGTSGSVNAFQLVFDGTACGCVTSFCNADGTAGAVPCPCGNDGSPGNGCNNSGATGGGFLQASGMPSPDTMVLLASNMLPSAPGIYLQGTAQIAPPGAVFGDGTRCIGGVLKRLAIKAASGGASSFPQAGDPSITSQSAALGDPIAPGSTRYYQVYYRDPDPGFCNPVPSTFNVTSAVSIAW